MYLELDGQGPLHVQLARALRTAILDGRLKPGSRLASTRVVSMELGLSRTTVMAAYEQLRAEGFISGRVGSGSYVGPVLTGTQAPAASPTLAPPSRYAQRMQEAMPRPAGPMYEGVRYHMQYGAPLINPALTTAWSRELAHAARYTDPHYPDPQGLPALREAVCDYLARRRGVRVDASRVLIVNGTQQALALTARVLLDEGDPVALEEPRYFGAYQVYRAHGARLVGVPVDEEGLICRQLPAQVPRLIFVTPSHQFPSGAVMSQRRRMELLRYASERSCWIVEDDYDSEFRYDVQPLPALRAMDEHDRVIYIGTFSKALLGSLRLGYMVLPSALCGYFKRAKWLDDMGCSSIDQAALAGFMQSGAFERHLRRASQMLRARRSALIEGLRRHAGDRLDIDDSHAGMHLVAWLRGMDHAQCSALIEYALAQGLGLHPIAPSYFSPPPRPGLLLGYAGLSVAELQAASALLGHCLRTLPAAAAA
ncbi:PLP-dependent aminotransferase family protein [Frateuria sp. YIM B11624]|uniref:MocR-like pyridoxine biosynthesis transcription factor PdxR n=1 Tax=Frateuria sp. YIM B11624 TaxID=3143185 RepID=UPI003C734969